MARRVRLASRGLIFIAFETAMLLLLSTAVQAKTPLIHAVPSAGDCRVFFVPGAFGGDDAASGYFIQEKEYFSEYQTFFETKGCATRKAVFPPDATIEERALILRDQLTRFAPEGQAVFLIAHSQGGLDARFAIQTLKLSNVKAVLSVGVPHEGTPVADWVITQRDRRSFAYWAFRALLGYDFDELRFVGEMTSEFLTQHAEAFKAAVGVQYYSAQAVCTNQCHFLLRILSAFLKLKESDGLIPAASQLFGKDLGRFNLDHVSTVGADSSKAEERKRLLDAFWRALHTSA